jgi:hydroxymethylglutaryl-CoA synthase
MIDIVYVYLTYHLAANYVCILNFSSRDINLQQLANDPVLAKDVEKASLKCSQTAFEMKTEPSLLVSRNVGNMYTPSLYSALASVLVR